MLTYVDRIGTLCYHKICRTVTKWISRTTDVNFWTKIFFAIVDQTYRERTIQVCSNKYTFCTFKNRNPPPLPVLQ